MTDVEVFSLDDALEGLPPPQAGELSRRAVVAPHGRGGVRREALAPGSSAYRPKIVNGSACPSVIVHPNC